MVKDHETMVEGREKIEGADQSKARPNTGKSRETGIGRHPLNRAPVGGPCGEETVRGVERRGDRVALGIPAEFVAAEDRDAGCGVGQPGRAEWAHEERGEVESRGGEALAAVWCDGVALFGGHSLFAAGEASCWAG